MNWAIYEDYHWHDLSVKGLAGQAQPAGDQAEGHGPCSADRAEDTNSSRSAADSDDAFVVMRIPLGLRQA